MIKLSQRINNDYKRINNYSKRKTNDFKQRKKPLRERTKRSGSFVSSFKHRKPKTKASLI